MVSGGLLARLDKAAIDEQLGDLDGVQGSTLAQVVGDHPDVEAVFDSCILANARDVSRILARGFIWRDVAAVLALVYDEAAWCIAQDVAGLVGSDLVFEFDVDRFE